MKIQEIVSAIKQRGKDAMDTISSAANSVGTDLAEGFNAGVEGVKQIIDEVNKISSMSPTQLTVALAKGFMNGVLQAKALGVEVKNFLANAPSKFADSLSNGLTNSVNLLREMGAQARDVATSGIAHLFVDLGKGLIAGVNGMNQLGQGALNFISTGINSVVGGLANGITDSVNAMAQLGQGAMNLVCSGANEFGNQLSQGLAEGSNAMIGLCQKAASFAATSVNNGWNKLTTGLQVATGWLNQIDQKTIQFGKKIMAIGKAKISQGFAKMGAVINKVKTSVAKLGNASKNAGRLEKISDFFKLKDIADAIKTKLEMAKARQADLKSKAVETASAMNKVKSNAAGIGVPIDNAKSKLAGLKDLASKFSFGKGDISKVFDMADTITRNKNQINAMNDGMQSTDALQDKIYQSAQNSRTEYGAFSQRVMDLNAASNGMFANNDETIAFAELMSKNMAMGTLSADQQASAMDQITQSMANGTVGSDAMQSMLSGAPALAQSLANELGVGTEKLMDMANSGEISSVALKNAMFGSADETNAKFAEMPWTFSELWTQVVNTLMEMFSPLLEFIGGAASWIGDNWGFLEPILKGIAVAIGLVVAALTIYNVIQWAMNSALLACPITWIVLAIIILIATIVILVNKLGGLKATWLTIMQVIKTAWGLFVLGMKQIGHNLTMSLMNIKLSWLKFKNAVVGFVLDMKVKVLEGLQNMINGAIGLINSFINAVNDIFKTNIEVVSEVTFAADAAAEAEAKKREMEKDINDQEEKMKKLDESFKEQQKKDITKLVDDYKARQEEIEAAKAENEEKGSVMDNLKKSIVPETPGGGGGTGGGGGGGSVADNTAQTAENTEAMKNSMDTTVEELAYLRDLAEQEAINRFTTAEIKIDMTNNNNIGSDMDIDGIVEQLEDKLGSAMLSAAEGVPA